MQGTTWCYIDYKVVQGATWYYINYKVVHGATECYMVLQPTSLCPDVITNI